MKKRYIILALLILLIEGYCLAGNNNTNNQTNNTATTTQTTANDFQTQVQNEIKDKHLLTDQTNVTYNSMTQALLVDQTNTVYYDTNSLKTSILDDTASILEVAAKHPNEINYVVIDYNATLLDQNRNEVSDRVYLGRYNTTQTNPVNWVNTYGDDEENLLQQKADDFWLHPLFTSGT